MLIFNAEVDPMDRLFDDVMSVVDTSPGTAGVTFINIKGSQRGSAVASRLMSMVVSTWSPGRHIPCDVINGPVTKLTTEEVNDMILEPGSHFRQHYNAPGAFNKAYYSLSADLKEMDDNPGRGKHHFNNSMIKDRELRAVVLKTLALSKDRLSRLSPLTYRRDLFLIHDAESPGQSIWEANTYAHDCYEPGSTTLIMLTLPAGANNK